MKLILPESWSCSDYDRTIAMDYCQLCHNISGTSSTEFLITAGENIADTNRVYAEITSFNTPYPVMIPLYL